MKKTVLFSLMLWCLSLLFVYSPIYGENLIDGEKSKGHKKVGYQLHIPSSEVMKTAGLKTSQTGTVNLPIWGTYYDIDADKNCNIFMIYHEGTVAAIYDVVHGIRYAVPDGSLFRDFLFSGISVGDNRVAVSWTPDGLVVKYAEFDLKSLTWSPVDILFTDDVKPPDWPNSGDTNRSDIEIDDQGNVMAVAQSDGKIKSRFKPKGHGWQSVQEAVPYDISEPTSPHIVSLGTKFYISTTYTIPGVPGLAGKTVAVFEWSGSWSKIHQFDIPGSPDANYIATGPNDSIYVTWLDWQEPPREYCTVGIGYRVGGKWRQENLYDKDKLGTLDHPPSTGVAVDESGNIVACYYDYNSSSTRSYLQSRKVDGVWSGREPKGYDAHIATVFSSSDSMFYTVFIDGGLKLETFNLNQTAPTPTPTPAPVVTSVSRYDLFEKKIQTLPGWTNPWTDVIVYAKFTHSMGERTIKGFYIGEDQWMVRFRPDQEGQYSYKIWSEPSLDIFNISGSFSCIAPREGQHGPVIRDGRFLKHLDGSDHYHLGGTAFGLTWRGPYLQFLQKYIDKGINYYRIGLNITWGRSQQGKVDGSWLNTFMWAFEPYPPTNVHAWEEMSLTAFKKLDESLALLLNNNAFAELALYDSSMKYVFGPNEDSSNLGTLYTVNDARQKYYLEYIANRYGEFSSLAYYEIGNEIRHNQYLPWQEEWPKAKEWVRWVGQTIKKYDPDGLVAYDPMWADTWWSYNPTNMGQYSEYTPDSWHVPLWDEDWCDVLNIHSDRSGEWWFKGADQMLFLSKYNKPTNNDEPHRKGYSDVPVTDMDLRRAMWLNAMVGNSYYTMHGVSNGDYCRGCIEDTDVIGGDHHTMFFKELGYFNFYPDWSLIQGSGQYLRAMHKDGVYVYYAIQPNGEFIFKTLKSNIFRMFWMNPENGMSAEEKVEGMEFKKVFTGYPEVVVFLKPWVPPTPTPTIAVVNTPTPTPTSSNGGGCISSARADGTVEGGESGNFFMSLLVGMLLICVIIPTLKKVL